MSDATLTIVAVILGSVTAVGGGLGIELLKQLRTPQRREVLRARIHKLGVRKAITDTLSSDATHHHAA